MTPVQAWEQAVAAFVADMSAAGANTGPDYAKRVRRLARDVAPLGPWRVQRVDVERHLAALPESQRRPASVAVRRFYAWAIADGRTHADPTPARKTPGPARRALPAGWRAWHDAWRVELRAAGYPETTIGLRLHHIGTLAHQLRCPDPGLVTGEQLVEWFATRQVEVETRRSYCSSVQAFYAWAVRTGRCEHDPAARLPRPRPAAPNPHPASDRAYDGALAAAAPREALMLRLAAELGLRRGEVCKVHSRDLLADDDGWSLVVHGKGSRDRVLPLTGSIAAALRALPAGWAFPGPTGHLGADYVGKRIAELLPAGVSMHALRHRFATRAYDLEHDVFTVQQLLGHSSPNTTRRYVKVQRATLRRTVSALGDLPTQHDVDEHRAPALDPQRAIA